ncbi:5789_t:CDS:1 [Acaulospora colombiana]|uniref:5789_t:CDS:1 n=1 Tax=Acaulospora colombiana TaxID=27376 RepID=A0ACA9KSE8_9GLOM|nr:5789_t:CDS:1 [Acaulospora colombiana]
MHHMDNATTSTSSTPHFSDTAVSESSYFSSITNESLTQHSRLFGESSYLSSNDESNGAGDTLDNEATDSSGFRSSLEDSAYWLPGIRGIDQNRNQTNGLGETRNMRNERNDELNEAHNESFVASVARRLRDFIISLGERTIGNLRPYSQLYSDAFYYLIQSFIAFPVRVVGFIRGLYTGEINQPF